ncbi:hypothetical protein [Klebsiella phage 05F01]|nr:hypothetical protein [Klebsiella phage 05F01]
MSSMILPFLSYLSTWKRQEVILLILQGCVIHTLRRPPLK